jgi:hypothetical protein
MPTGPPTPTRSSAEHARKADELGEQIAAEPQAWALDAFGPPPDAVGEREEWQGKIGAVAAYRELRGHDNDAEPLGPAPEPGQVEAYAAYRASWRVLGRPEVDREELDLSDGRLRMRVRAHEREATWAPRYVGNELAGTHQAAATHRRGAALRAVEGTASTDPDERARLQADSAQAAALADTLDGRAAELQGLDDARAQWLAHTAGTRAAAERAKAELAARHADDAEPEQHVTAEEWLAAHRDATAEEDRHRAVTEADVADQHEIEEPRRADDLGEHVDIGPDLREVAAAERAPVAEDVVRVPTAAETSDAIERANRALAEMRARDAMDAHEAAEHRAEELSRWHATDQATAETEAVDDVAEHEPAAFSSGPTP